ncbi:hypothetical protein HOLleu_31563 [Holothuria leucospilota]|uniref:Endonuclease/exonuclease/phosphatase domain-containing protein n=1 Tax=Holothuria leucospilota TaxID=206669 RepID=A0A9Q1BGC6_HOLLE|nr:hypothetical protein HOLleu_31563 [Holothuria leucospilota]
MAEDQLICCEDCGMWAEFVNLGLNCTFEEASRDTFVFVCQKCNRLKELEGLLAAADSSNGWVSVQKGGKPVEIAEGCPAVETSNSFSGLSVEDIVQEVVEESKEGVVGISGGLWEGEKAKGVKLESGVRSAKNGRVSEFYYAQSDCDSSKGKHVSRAVCGVKVMFANVRSLFNKFSEFLAHISIDNPDIVGVTETWLHSDISNSEIQVPGYKIFRHDRADTVCGRGGGVLLYVKDSINCVDVTNKFSSGFSDCLWCELSFVNESGTPLVVGIIYRSPNLCADNNQSLFESFRKVSSKRAVVFGDFNFPDIDWHSCTSGSHGRDFLEAVSDGFFTQHVLFPTREDNCLDLVLSTDENMVRNVASGGKIGSSDHDLISFELLCFSNLQGSDKTVLDFSKANFTHAKELLTMDWVARLSHLGPAEAWSVFRNIVTDTTKLCIPLKKAVVKNRPIWMSREVLRAARKKRKCWRRYRVSKNSDDFAVYKKQELLVKNLVIDTKAKFEKQLAKEVKVNPKSFQAYVRSKQKVKEGVGPLQGIICFGDL